MEAMFNYMCTKAAQASTDMECHTDTMYDRGQPTRLNYFDVNHNVGKARNRKIVLFLAMNLYNLKIP